MARRRTLLPLGVALALAAVAGCDLSDEPSAASGTDTTADDVGPVERFVQTRQQGLPADDFLSADALVAYEVHERGLWLYDDTLPGGPGGQYKRFSIEESGAENSLERFVVRIEVVWDGGRRAE